MSQKKRIVTFYLKEPQIWSNKVTSWNTLLSGYEINEKVVISNFPSI